MNYKILFLFLLMMHALQLDAKRVVITKKDPVVVAPKYPPPPNGHIVADQQGNVLNFDLGLVYSNIEIIKDNAVIYSAVINENGIVELPEELCGEYELRVYVGDAVY